MKDYIQVFTTTESKEEAEKIASCIFLYRPLASLPQDAESAEISFIVFSPERGENTIQQAPVPMGLSSHLDRAGKNSIWFLI